MKTVGADCDGLAKSRGYQSTNEVEEVSNENGKKVRRCWRFFNDIEYQDMKLNILRFEEWIFNNGGEQTHYVYWEWIVSWKLTKRKKRRSSRSQYA
jgi:hypothetical protein